MALSPRDKRAVTILGGVAGLALVGFLVMNVLGGGGGEEAATPPPVTSGGPVTQPSVSPTPSTPRETLPPVVLAGVRDPFSPPPAFASPSGGVSPSAGGTSGGGTGTPTSTGTASPTQTPTTPGGGASSTLGGHTVVLDDIFDNGTKAQIEVDGTVYTVTVGHTFDSNFRLASINGSCARVQFGDEAADICLNPQK
jgi:hypothetical protein